MTTHVVQEVMRFRRSGCAFVLMLLAGCADRSHTSLSAENAHVVLRHVEPLHCRAGADILARVSVRLVALSLLMVSCTNGVQTAGSSATVRSGQPPLPRTTESIDARSVFNCDGSIQQLAEPPTGYETIGDSLALDTSGAFGTALSGLANPTLRLQSKTGLAVRTHAVSELIVPEAFLGHLAFQWNIPTPTTDLLIGPCPGNSNWIVFPGLFFVSKVNCYDFVVRTSDGDHKVSVGLGAPCPGQAPPMGFTES